MMNFKSRLICREKVKTKLERSLKKNNDDFYILSITGFLRLEGSNLSKVRQTKISVIIKVII